MEDFKFMSFTHNLKLFWEPSRVLERELSWADFNLENVYMLSELIDRIDRVLNLKEQLA